MEKIAKFNQTRFASYLTKAAQTVYVLTDDSRQTLHKSLRRVVLGWKKPRLERAPSTDSVLGWASFTRLQVTLPLQNTTFPIVYNVTWKEVVMETIPLFIYIWTNSLRKEWDGSNYISLFPNLFFRLFGQLKGQIAGVEYRYADNTGHITHDNLLALLIVFDDITCKLSLTRWRQRFCFWIASSIVAVRELVSIWSGWSCPFKSHMYFI